MPKVCKIVSNLKIRIVVKGAIAKGAVISYVSIFLNIVISFVYTPWMIRTIGVSDYGLYNLAASFIGYFILDFGMSSSIARFVAKYRAEGDERKVENILGLTARIYLWIDVLIFLVLFVLYFFLSDIFVGLTPEETERFKLIYCITGVFAVCSFVFKPVGGAMMAYEYFVANKALDMITRVGTVLLVMLVLLLGGNVFMMVLVYGAVGLTVSLMKYLLFIRQSGLKINWRYDDKDEMKALFAFSIWIFLLALAQRFRFTLVQSVLGICSNTTEISLFSVGMMIEGLVFTITAGLSGLFLPKVTRMAIMDNKQSVEELMVRVGRIELYVISLIFSGFVLFGKEFILLWLGGDFVDVYWIVILLIFTNVVTLTQTIANDYVMAVNQVKTTAIYLFCTSLAGILLTFVLAPRYGAVGCAFATGLGLLLNMVLVNIFYARKLELDMMTFFKDCHGKILPLLTAFALVVWFLKPLVSLDNWMALALSVGMYTALFFIVCYLFLLNPSEKSIVKSLFIIKNDGA